jgi:hypothetical protein
MAFYDRLFKALGYVPSNKVQSVFAAGQIEKRLGLAELAEPSYARRPMLKLEQIYFSDPIVFNAVQYYVKSVLTPGYFVSADTPEVKHFFEKFLEAMNFDSILEKTVNHLCVFGNAYWEIIWNRAHEDIMKLEVIDPKTMDFKRDLRTNQPVVDELGNPTTYVQTSPLTGKQIEIDVERIAHFKLYSLGSSMQGIGLIEPIFKTAIIKLNIEEALGQTVFRHGFPIMLVSVGDKDKFPMPTPNDINAAHEAVKNLNYKTDLAYPWYWKIEMAKPHAGEVEKLRSNLEYFIDQEIAGLGLPKTFVTGSGGDSNRATLDIQNAVFERTINLIQKNISSVVEQKVFKPYASVKGFDEVPSLEWNPLSPADVTQKIDNIIKLLTAGLLDQKDVELLKPHIKQLLDLPRVERERQELRGEDDGVSARRKA